MQFHHLEYFIQAVECKSLNRASRKLNVSLQALCAGIAALEKSLGYPLLIRSRNGVSPTQNGEIVFRDAAGFSELVQKWRALSPVETERQVMVKFGASTTLMRWLVPQVILRTQQRQPHIYFDFYESFVENVFANLLDRHSLGLITAINERVEGVYRIRLMQNDMEYTVGPEDRCVVVINRKHPFAQLPSLTRAQLRELKLVWNPRRDEHFVYRDICQYFSKEKSIHIPEQENLLRMISMKPEFAAVLPQSALLTENNINGYICGKDVEDFPMKGNIWFIWPRRLSSAEEAVRNITLDILEDCVVART